MKNTDDRLSVLFIDSNDKDRTYYAKRLTASSPQYVLHQAANGQAGLALFHAEPVDCVIVEIDLPDISGFEVLLKLVDNPKHPEVAVIVLTHITNPYILDLAVKNGALASLRKDTTSGDILDRTVLRAVSSVQRDHKRMQPRICGDASDASSESGESTLYRQGQAGDHTPIVNQEITANPIGVLLVDDHALIRQTVRGILNDYPNIEVLAEASDGEEALVRVDSLRPAVVVMDVNMPRMDGITATRLIRTQYPEIAVIGLTVQLNDYVVYSMQEAGASESIAKESAVMALYSAIQRGVASIRPVLIMEEGPLPSQDLNKAERFEEIGEEETGQEKNH